MSESIINEMNEIGKGFVKVAKQKLLKEVVKASCDWHKQVLDKAYKKYSLSGDSASELYESEKGVHFVTYLHFETFSEEEALVILKYAISTATRKIKKLWRISQDITETLTYSLRPDEVSFRLVLTIPWRPIILLAKQIKEEDEKIKEKYKDYFEKKY